MWANYAANVGIKRVWEDAGAPRSLYCFLALMRLDICLEYGVDSGLVSSARCLNQASTSGSRRSDTDFFRWGMWSFARLKKDLSSFGMSEQSISESRIRFKRFQSVRDSLTELFAFMTCLFFSHCQ